MKILFINRMAAMVRGGGETFDLEISRALRALGHEPHLLTGLPFFGRSRVELNHPDVHFIRTPYTGDLPWDRIPGGWRLRQFDFRQFERAAVRWVLKRQENFDVLQVCELPAFVNSWRKVKGRLPLVMRMPGPQAFVGFGADAEKHVDALIASGTSIAHYEEQGVSCINIPNGVDVDAFSPGESERAVWGLPPSGPVVLCIARLQACKNHAMLIQAFCKAFSDDEDARLLLAGGGPLKKELKGVVDASGLKEQILFLGDVPHERLPSLLRSSDLSVIPSDYESFSFVALESMSCGIPVITTATEWVPGLIGRDQGGVTIPVGDANAMAAALTRLMQDHTGRARMGQWGRERVLECHGWKTSAEKLVDVYTSLIA